MCVICVVRLDFCKITQRMIWKYVVSTIFETFAYWSDKLALDSLSSGLLVNIGAVKPLCRGNSGPRNIQLNTAPSTAMRLTSVLIFGGYLVVCVHGKKICGPNEYPISNYPPDDCMPCDKCHEGYGLEPRCGTPIIYQVDKTECKPCPPQKFNDKYDSSSCMNCHRCAEHEIVAKQCTNKSDTVCSGTCEEGFYFSGKDGTHSCQKCSYCCDEESDEDVPDCKVQGFSDTKQYCSPRPDKDCSPATGHKNKAEVSKHSKLSRTEVHILIGVLGTATILALVGTTVAIYIYLRRNKAGIEASQRNSAHYYASNGPEAESQAEHSVHYSGSSSEANILSGACEGGKPSDAFPESSSSAQAPVNVIQKQNPASLADVSVYVTNDDGNHVHDLAPADVGGVANVSVINSASGGKNPVIRQSSKDSQRSGDGADVGSFRRNSSTQSFTETVKKRFSKRQDSLVHNEEEDTDVVQGPITILQEPSSQEKKEGSKVEFGIKCKVRDSNTKLLYQWFKDGTGLTGMNEATLQLKSVLLKDFGWYKCCVTCEDNPNDFVESSLVELDVTPRDGTRYQYLNEVDPNVLERVAKLLTQTKHGLGCWRQVAFKYEMDQLDIKSLETDPEAGRKTLGYLYACKPYLTVYDFCKTLKEYDIRRLDVVGELLRHLSVRCSSKVYL